MRLFIAEKPSLARAIAEALPGPRQSRGDYIECAEGNVVAYCRGHILELAKPQQLNPAYEKWSLQDLPILPSPWRLVPTAPELLKVLKEQLRRATSVVHAGDPDREGQLLVDEVLEYLGNTKPVRRLLLKDLSPEGVRKQLSALEPNERFALQTAAAKGRQRADWLVGMNLSRLYTLLGQAGGYEGVISIGRVQTPVLGLVVRRDLEIERFRSKPFFELHARMEAGGASFSARWVPGAAVESSLDEEGRLVQRAPADEAQRRTQGQPGRVVKATREKVQEQVPLPFSLADLQKEAARALGLTLEQTLEAAQALYEKHKLTSYPRSDCSYLPESHHAEGPTVAAAVATSLPVLAQHVAKANFGLRSRAWNDKRVTAHYGIIPTSTARPGIQLSDAERGVYELIARRYLCQFYPAAEYLAAELEMDVAGERFRARGRQLVSAGWQALLPAAEPAEGGQEEEEGANAALPPLREGDAVRAADVRVKECATQPPKHFTEASLLEAMMNVDRYVEDPALKAIFQSLRSDDNKKKGIGTAATRHTFVETLLERGFIAKRGKGKTPHLISTPAGRSIIQLLPRDITTPDMTAYWEGGLRRVEAGTVPLERFLSVVQTRVQELVTQAKARGPLQVGPAHPCPKSAEGCAGTMRRVAGKDGKKPFWSCRVCRATAEDASGAPSAGGGGARPRTRRRVLSGGMGLKKAQGKSGVGKPRKPRQSTQAGGEA